MPVQVNEKFIDRLGRLELASGAAVTVEVFENLKGYPFCRIAFHRRNGGAPKWLDVQDFCVPMVHEALGRFLEMYRVEEPMRDSKETTT